MNTKKVVLATGLALTIYTGTLATGNTQQIALPDNVQTALNEVRKNMQPLSELYKTNNSAYETYRETHKAYEANKNLEKKVFKVAKKVAGEWITPPISLWELFTLKAIPEIIVKNDEAIVTITKKTLNPFKWIRNNIIKSEDLTAELKFRESVKELNSQRKNLETSLNSLVDAIDGDIKVMKTLKKLPLTDEILNEGHQIFPHDAISSPYGFKCKNDLYFDIIISKARRKVSFWDLPIWNPSEWCAHYKKWYAHNQMINYFENSIKNGPEEINKDPEV